ncbi:LANO_0F12156g1_1 [Lachancea nothofagi CBS 11611]|uniref:LANO_0F12156g1_1 n=1 Tax=Lachancea nothofagi CBS 11611 TaxID=1266666 RepID=A0A1G4KB81_9SACH|nr:LANO_0F12156g1_1 [Lachancea nothofagi CBS 11611]
MALRTFGKFVLTPVAGFGLGIATFMDSWPAANDDGLKTVTLKRSVEQQRQDILSQLQKHDIYQDLIRKENVEQWSQSEKIVQPHRDYHVGQGLLYGPGRLEIDPLVLHDPESQELVVFYHLGHNLSNEKGKVHKGVVSLLLDEALCYCGFPTLPSKAGVTAKLDLKFHHDVPTDCTVVLKAHVKESKGRKCVIEGSLQTLPSRKWYKPWTAETSTVLATATCILVEPKWFKHVKWMRPS